MKDIEPVYLTDHAEIKIKAQKVSIPKAQMEAFEDAVNPKLHWKTRVKRLLEGKNKAGQIAGNIIDIGLLFVPYRKPINTLRSIVKRQIKTEEPMKNAFKRAFTSDGGSITRLRDEDGKLSTTAIAAFLIRAVVLVGVFWAANELGLNPSKIISLL